MRIAATEIECSGEGTFAFRFVEIADSTSRSDGLPSVGFAASKTHIRLPAKAAPERNVVYRYQLRSDELQIGSAVYVRRDKAAFHESDQPVTLDDIDRDWAVDIGAP